MTIHRLTLPFSPGNFLNMTVLSHPPYSPDLASYDFCLFPWLKIKLKGCHFDTVWHIELELLAVLNTLTEHGIQDAFRKCQKLWEQWIHMEGDHFEGDNGLYAQS
jgi:hypothetical protein